MVLRIGVVQMLTYCFREVVNVNVEKQYAKYRALGNTTRNNIFFKFFVLDLYVAFFGSDTTQLG